MLNGATRAMMDNGGLSSGPQLIIDQDVIEPADKQWKITPRKIWRKKQGVELPGGNLKNAIVDIEISSRQEELMNIIRYALEMADRVATMPIQQQGQQGVTQETAEGRRILQNNASVQKRFLDKMFDDHITEPHIGRYYEYLLMYADDPSMKRDLVIDARGSSALFERDAQNIAVGAVGSLLNDPEFGGMSRTRRSRPPSPPRSRDSLVRTPGRTLLISSQYRGTSARRCSPATRSPGQRRT